MGGLELSVKTQTTAWAVLHAIVSVFTDNFQYQSFFKFMRGLSVKTQTIFYINHFSNLQRGLSVKTQTTAWENNLLGRTEGYTGLYEEINKRLAEGYEITSFHQSGLSSEGYLLVTVILRKE